jgi:two-component system, oxyanion-binding sensor
MTLFRIGYLPLTDAAALAVAAEKGFAADEGLRFALHRETNWASLRDNLIVGNLDGAHMLAPLAVATALGIGHPPFPLDAPVLLSLNGNAVTLSALLADSLGPLPDDLESRARRLVSLAQQRKREGRLLTFATVFRFSSHTLLLRALFEKGGGDLSSDAELLVLAPSLMVEGLRSGIVDGFCAGSPWNLIAGQALGSIILATGEEIIPDLAEKLLVVPRALAPDKAKAIPALKRALGKASAWLNEPGHHQETALLLSRPLYLNCDPEPILASLQGRIKVAKAQKIIPHYIRLAQPDFADQHRQSIGVIANAMLKAGMITKAQSEAVSSQLAVT